MQMPHCSAACSRNFCCSGCSSVALRHALDGLDRCALGLGAEHQAGADQAAVEHARCRRRSRRWRSLPCCRSARARRAARRAGSARASHRNSTGVAVDGGGDVVSSPSVLPRARRARCSRRAARQHARDLDPVFLGAALVVDRPAGGARPPRPARSSAASSSLRADQRVGRLGRPAAPSAPPRRARPARRCRCRARRASG